MARPSNPNSPKVKRDLGPRVTYVLLRNYEGMDNKTLKSLVAGICTSKGDVTDALDSGDVATYVKVTTARKPRAAKLASVA